MNRVVVRDGKGREVARGKPGDWYVSDQATRRASARRRRNLHVQVNGLRPGYDVEVVVTRQLGRPASGSTSWSSRSPSTLPRLRSALVVTGDVAAIATVASPGVETRYAAGRDRVRGAAVRRSSARSRCARTTRSGCRRSGSAPAGATWAARGARPTRPRSPGRTSPTARSTRSAAAEAARGAGHARGQAVRAGALGPAGDHLSRDRVRAARPRPARARGDPSRTASATARITRSC